MDLGPLVNEQINAGARFLSAFQQYVPIQTAFWLKDSDEANWYLYVASEQITDDNFDLAYGEVGRITDEIQDPWFDPIWVKLIGADDPLAKGVLELQMRYRGRTPLRLHDVSFGGQTADELYVYPSPIPVPAP
jgi:hypothetical protein